MPLTSIITLAQVVREDSTLPPRHDASLKLIEQAGYRVLNKANLTLDLYRMERGTYQLNLKAVNLRAVIGRVLTELEAHIRTRGVTVEIEWEGFPGTPGIYGDELLSHSMLSNLVKNAVEASAAGGTVRIRVTRGDPVRIAIHNDGAIPEPMRARFFEKYATGKAGGTGLGAYSARLMAETQGGLVAVESSADGGTTVTVDLPYAPDARESFTAEWERPAPAAVPAAPETPEARTILVVDDDSNVRSILRRMLARPLWKVDEAENGPLALRRFAEGTYDTVILDIEMPIMDGYAVARLLRALEASRGASGRRANIVAFSSNDDADTKRRALEAGIDQYIAKPAPSRSIVNAVRGGATQMTAEASADAALADPDIRELMPAFLAAKEQEGRDLGDALARGDAAAARAIAHRLRGALGLYGFSQAAAVAAAIESDAGDNSLAKAREWLPHLETQLRMLRARYRESSPTG